MLSGVGMAAALEIPADARLALETYTRNLRWSKGHPEVLEGHRGKFVVISGEQLVLATRSRAKAWALAKGIPGAYVTFVPPRGLLWVL